MFLIAVVLYFLTEVGMENAIGEVFPENDRIVRLDCCEIQTQGPGWTTLAVKGYNIVAYVVQLLPDLSVVESSLFFML